VGSNSLLLGWSTGKYAHFFARPPSHSWVDVVHNLPPDRSCQKSPVQQCTGWKIGEPMKCTVHPGTPLVTA